MEFDYSALLGKIVEKFGTRRNFALAIGLSERSLSLKLNNKVSWKDIEIMKSIELLEIDKENISLFFLKPKVQMFEQNKKGE